MRSLLAIFGTGLAVISPLHALPGLSPVWERLYNNNQPFSATNPDHDPDADPDGDGFTNRQESTAGTNPFSAIPGEGFPRLTIEPHLWLPGVYSMTFMDSQPGKDYLFTHSTDLVNWTPFPEGLPGTGFDLELDIETLGDEEEPAPEKAFFRTVISDQPNPGGMFTPWELGIMSSRHDIGNAVLPPPINVDGPIAPPPDPNSDGTGPTDSIDASPHDNQINWIRTPEARYIYIPVGGVPSGYRAVDASDAGMILFNRESPPANISTGPVGYVWKGFAEDGPEASPVYFSPGDVKLRGWKIANNEMSWGVESVPMPAEDPDPDNDPIASYSVSLHAIGDEGSILGNATYKLSQNGGHNENPIRGAYAKMAFLWQAGNHDSCRLLGTNHGYMGEELSYTADYAAGFYMDEGVYRAVITRQTVGTNYNTPAPLSVQAFPTSNPLSSKGLTGQNNRTSERAPGPRMTHNGVVLIEDHLANTPRYYVCGNSPLTSIEQWITHISAFPESQYNWGIGGSGQNFKVRDGDKFDECSSANSVLQWDQWGVGIGPDATRAIWRNGRMHSLASVVSGMPSNISGMKPRKITKSGLIWVGNDAGTINGLLVPIEVIAPQLDYHELSTDLLLGADELRVAKMYDSLKEGGALQIDDDAHRFYVRIRVPVPVNNLSASIGTTDSPNGVEYDDNPTEIPLQGHDSSMRSQSQILVSDSVDDAADGVDDRVGDRTHIVALGGNVEISSIKIGTANYPLQMIVPVKLKKTVTIHVVRLSDSGATEARVLQDVKIANERFAQVGVKIVIGSHAIRPVPTHLIADSSIMLNFGNDLSTGAKALIDAYGTPSIEDFDVFYCKETITFVGSAVEELAGFAIFEASYPSKPQYANNLFMHSGGTKPFTLAHEIGHTLTDRGHTGPEFPEEHSYSVGVHEYQKLHNMMSTPTSGSNILNGTKRLYRIQQNWIWDHRLSH